MYFRVHNPNNGKVNISNIALARGISSFYRLNVDGVAGKSFSNVEIAAHDSIYVFVEVTIDPNADPNVSPFIYKDSILFNMNGHQQHVDLIAFGQNAYYHMPDPHNTIYFSNTQALYFQLLEKDSVWPNDKPHLIYNYVVVDSAFTLTIQKNTHIYFHNGGGIWIYRYGKIKVNGEFGNEVTFQGDRLEQEYKDVPGQWDRIWINEGSTGNLINYAVMKNAYIGVQAGYAAFGGYGPLTSTTIPNQLDISNTKIQNCSYAAFLGQFYNVRGGNNVFSNCGQYLLQLAYGGNYNFRQCTFANYWNQTSNAQSGSQARTTPSFYFNNYFNGTILNGYDSLYFGNCILTGSLAEEFKFDTLAVVHGFMHGPLFDHCLMRTSLYGQSTSHFINSQDIFNNSATYDFHLSSPNNPAYTIGDPSLVGNYTLDIEGKNRTVVIKPDLGAYQHQ